MDRRTNAATRTRSHGRVVALPTRRTPAVQPMADSRGTRLVLMCTGTRCSGGHAPSAGSRKELGGTRTGLGRLRERAGRRHDNARTWQRNTRGSGESQGKYDGGRRERLGRRECGGWDRSDPERRSTSARRAGNRVSECQTECGWVVRPSARMQKSRSRRAGGPSTDSYKNAVILRLFIQDDTALSGRLQLRALTQSKLAIGESTTKKRNVQFILPPCQLVSNRRHIRRTQTRASTNNQTDTPSLEPCVRRETTSHNLRGLRVLPDFFFMTSSHFPLLFRMTALGLMTSG